MWRSFFMAVGIFTMILGAETLVVDHVVFASNRRIPAIVTGQQVENNQYSSPFSNRGYTPTGNSSYQNVGYANSNYYSPNQAVRTRFFKTKDWMPWSLLAIGAIVVMYTYSLPVSSTRSTLGDE